MGGHVLLEIEVGELVGLVELEELGQRSVGNDFTTVVFILEIVCANIEINLTSNISSSHLDSLDFTKESGELVGDDSRLDKSAGIAATLPFLINGSRSL